MKKDNIRDYATEAFRFYARLGKPSYRILKAQYMTEAMEEYSRAHEKSGQPGRPTEAALMYAEKQVEKKEAELLDILAVEKVYYSAKRDVREIIELVYFESPDESLKKGEISERVHKASLWTYNSEREVYRILKAARTAFGIERKLRV